MRSYNGAQRDVSLARPLSLSSHGSGEQVCLPFNRKRRRRNDCLVNNQFKRARMRAKTFPIESNPDRIRANWYCRVANKNGIYLQRARITSFIALSLYEPGLYRCFFFLVINLFMQLIYLCNTVFVGFNIIDAIMRQYYDILLTEVDNCQLSNITVSIFQQLLSFSFCNKLKGCKLLNTTYFFLIPM